MTFKDPYTHRGDSLRVMSTHSGNDEVGRVRLSSRETQILSLLATGVSYKEIAHRVFLSKDTVKYHCKNLYLKLRVRSRTEALVAAAQMGLLHGWYLHPHPQPVSEEGCA